MDVATLAMAAMAANKKLTPDWLAFLDLLNDGSQGACSLSSGTSTLTSDIYRYSSLSVSAGATVTSSSNWLVLLVNGTAQIDGTVSVSGKGGLGGVGTSGGSGGSSPTQPTLTGYNSPNYATGSGGQGGGYSAYYGAIGANTLYSTTSSGTINGNAGTGPANIGQIPNDLMTLLSLKGGGGGAGNAFTGTGTNAIAGNGGAGAGIIIIVAKTIQGAGAVRADGLQGTQGTANSGVPGAGGGGGGGCVILVAGQGQLSMTASANGGAALAGIGSGGSGGAGGNGSVIKIQR